VTSVPIKITGTRSLRTKLGRIAQELSEDADRVELTRSEDWPTLPKALRIIALSIGTLGTALDREAPHVGEETDDE